MRPLQNRAGWLHAAVAVILASAIAGCRAPSPNDNAFEAVAQPQPGFPVDEYRARMVRADGAMRQVRETAPRLESEDPEERDRAMAEIGALLQEHILTHGEQQEELYAFADRELGPLYTHTLRFQHGQIQQMADMLVKIAGRLPTPFAARFRRELPGLVQAWSAHREVEAATVEAFVIGSEQDRLWAQQHGLPDATWEQATRARAAQEPFQEDIWSQRNELMQAVTEIRKDMLPRLDAPGEQRQAMRDIAAEVRKRIGPHTQRVAILFDAADRLRGKEFTRTLRFEHELIDGAVGWLEQLAADPAGDVEKFRRHLLVLLERIPSHTEVEVLTIGGEVGGNEGQRKAAEGRLRLREQAARQH